MSATFDDHLDDVPFCAVCGRQFTNDEWETRHTLPDGEDAHAGCCGPCARGEAS